MRLFLILVAFLSGLVARAGTSLRPDNGAFIENKGQWPVGVSYMTPVSGGYMFFQNHAFRTVLFQSVHPQNGREALSKNPYLKSFGHCFEAEFVGGKSKNVEPSGVASPTRYNFFMGKDPAHWGTDSRAFPEIVLKELYPGVDVKVLQQDAQLKYDIMVRKAEDIQQVKIRYKGLNSINIKDGKLVLKTSIGNLVEGIPLAYQTINGKRMPIACRYQLSGTTVRFDFPNGYKSGFPLVVDPLLIFYTFSGSLADNWGSSAVGDAFGNSFVAGTVYGTNFPTTLGALDGSYNGVGTGSFSFDIGIQKFNPSGTQLLFSTFLGGSNAESPHSLNIDEGQNLLIMGTTSSSNFPVSPNGFQTTFKGGPQVDPMISTFRYRLGSDLFITRLSKTGSILMGSTYLGGTANDGLLTRDDALTMNYGDGFRGDLVPGPNGTVLVASLTRSGDFPTRQASQPTLSGQMDGVVCRLSYGLDSLLWSTYLGGSELDALFSIQMQGPDKVAVCGGSRSPDFPTTPGAYQTMNLPIVGSRKNAGCDAIIASYAVSSGILLNSTFSGSNEYDQAYLMQTDPVGNIYILGQTEGQMPKTAGTFGTLNGPIFIQKFDPTLSNLIWGTAIGGTSGSALVPSAFLIDSCERIYFSGWGGESNFIFEDGFTGGSTFGFPVSAGALKTTTDGSDFYFCVLARDADSLLFGTYFGGNVRGEHVDGGMSRFDKSGTITQASCGCKLGTSYFPGTTGSYQPEIKSTNCNQGVIKINLGQTLAKYSFNAVASCGQTVTFTNLSSNANQFVWYWGDGDSLVTNQITVSHFFNLPGRYVVILKAISNQVCNRNAFYSDTIVVSNPFNFESDTTRFFYCKGEVTSPEFETEPGITARWLQTHDFIGGNVFNPVIQPTTPFLYTIEYRTLNGCKKNRYFQTIPKTPIQLTIRDSFDLKPCQSKGRVFLKAGSNGSDYYRWKIEDSVFSGPVFQVILKDNTSFLVNLKGQLTGCVDSINYQVNIPPFNYQLFPKFETSNRIVNCSDSEIQFSNFSENALAYIWEFGDGSVSTDVNPVHQYSESGNYRVKLQARNQFCDSTLTQEIIYRKISIPNLVTPNTDGKNDFFAILGIEEEFGLDVFNRWGERLFSSSNYKNNWSPVNLTDGVYFFQIRFKNGVSCINWLDVVR